MKKTTVPILLLFLLGKVDAQQAMVNSGSLKIFTGSPMTSFGDFTNASSASFINNGSLYIKGNFANDQSLMPAGTGTLFLNGSSLQSLNGSQPFKTYNLNTDNSAGIFLNNDLSINGTHTFTAGVIGTSATPHYVIYESGSSYTGASDAKHVNGWVKKIGSTDFVFPTGNGTYLREISLSNLASASEFDVKYSGVTYDVTNLQPPIVSMNPNEHWTVNRISGGTAKVQLNWNNSKIGFPNYVINDVRAAVYSGGQWINAGGTATGDVASSGSVTSGDLASFGRMGIGSISFVVPLKFIGVSAIRESSSVLVQWQTANEMNVLNYDVQRSVDGVNFLTVGTIRAANKDPQSYRFPDLNVPAFKLYYRIQANDADGKTSYSRIVIVTMDNVQKIQLLNNPVKGFMQLSMQNIPASVYSYRLINAAGQVCQRGSFHCEGSAYIVLPVDQVSPGAYTLVLMDASEKKQFKVLIQ